MHEPTIDHKPRGGPKRLLLFIGVLVLSGLSIPYLLYDKTTLAAWTVNKTEIRVMYNRDNFPLLWLSGAGGVTWDAHGPGRHGSGRLSGSATYDLPEDVIVELNTDHLDRFTITKWGSSQTSTEWVVDFSDDHRVNIREYKPDHSSSP